MRTKPKVPDVLWLSVVIFFLLWHPALTQMSSTNYEIPVSVMDATGKQKSSDNYKIKDAVGQPTPVGDPKTSSEFKLVSGFIYSEFIYTHFEEYIKVNYVYGDANLDCLVDIGDVVYLINYLFTGTSAPRPMNAGDPNDDCIVDVGDIVYLINHLFTGTSPPKPGCVDPDP